MAKLVGHLNDVNKGHYEKKKTVQLTSVTARRDSKHFKWKTDSGVIQTLGQIGTFAIFFVCNIAQIVFGGCLISFVALKMECLKVFVLAKSVSLISNTYTC